MKYLKRSYPLFLLSYALLPHGLINRFAARFFEARLYQPVLKLLIRRWIIAGRINMADFEENSYASLQDFFLRRLRAGARPISRGVVAPVDGHVVGCGSIEENSNLHIKGQAVSIGRAVNGSLHSLSVDGLLGGSYISIFLSPSSYHRIHMPTSGHLLDCRWVPGRYFPQNEEALKWLPDVYVRNERLVLRCRTLQGVEYLLVLVGASLVGGIHLKAINSASWRKRGACAIDQFYNKGEEIANFAFGSTVVLLAPKEWGHLSAAIGASVRVGEKLWDYVDGHSDSHYASNQRSTEIV